MSVFTGTCVHAWLFYMGAGDLNSDLYACTARALPLLHLLSSPALQCLRELLFALMFLLTLLLFQRYVFYF